MTTPQTLGDRMAIEDLLARFFLSFDDRDWTAMRGCLAETVWTDYSSFRKVPPGEISGERYVAQREAALSRLDMQHNYLNLRVEISGATASGGCNYVIHRFDPEARPGDVAHFHSYGRYEFGFAKTDGVWRIDHIRQILLRNEGNPEIHGATRTEENTRHV